MKPGTVWTSLVVAALTLGVMVYAGLEALTFNEASMWFPAFVSIVGVICSVAIIVKDVVTLVRRRLAPVAAAGGSTVEPDTPVTGPADDDEATDLAVLRSVAYWLGWMVGLALVIVLIGAFVGMPIWLFCVLRFAGRQSVLFSIIGTVAATAILFLVTNTLDFYVPQGLFA
ncbi:hypothetical protein [Actinophytocola sp.]|uniref:hypothetical protein n=1 Tax=Actinophytocola sp. TaxID=1872138 RepID=UPI0025BD8C3E|nr:hypothetical protein [Actinophytocola sp.]